MVHARKVSSQAISKTPLSEQRIIQLRDNKMNITSQVLDNLKKRGAKSALLAEFTAALFADADIEDLEQFSIDVLADIVADAHKAYLTRQAKTSKIRIYEPDFTMPTSDEADEQDRLTIIEIVNDDIPFLLDSIMGEIQERGLKVGLVLHPVMIALRDGRGKLKDMVGEHLASTLDGARESYIHIHVDVIDDKAVREDLQQALEDVVEATQLAVADWRAMLVRLTHAMTSYTQMPPPVAVSDLAESIQFLKWLSDNHFTFLGMREYRIEGGAKNGALKPVPKTGLGILRDNSVRVLRRGNEMAHLTPEVRAFFFGPDPLIITKANVRSLVHRRAHMDYIGVKIYDEKGNITGELRVVGLFTSAAYTRSVKHIPFLRHKADLILRRSAFGENSHSGKALLNVLETFPRDELFQIDVDYLYDVAMGIQKLELSPRPRVFARIDQFDRFVSLLVYVPRDRYSTEMREKICNFLGATYEGRVSAYYPFFPEGPLVRLHVIIGRYEGKTPHRAQDFLEAEISRIVRNWEDDLESDLKKCDHKAKAKKLIARYRNAFSGSYQESFEPATAIRDIMRVEQLNEDNHIAISLREGEEDGAGQAKATLYHLGGSIPLSRRVPVLENLGFSVIDERSYRIMPNKDNLLKTADTGPKKSLVAQSKGAVAASEANNGAKRFKVSLHDMRLELPAGTKLDFKADKERLEECFLAVWRGQAANDAFNQLVFHIGLTWREAAMMRAFGAYFRQIRIPYGQAYLCQTLLRHPDVTQAIISLFRTRFDPNLSMSKAEREKEQKSLVRKCERLLQKIPSLDEDRILRHFLSTIQATLRTNFYQTDEAGAHGPAIAFKIKSASLEALPEPKPYAEIFVYSPRVEGIHLRGGRIARGGLRWSDRPQDFRTEILSLAKAQQVKNTVIVPTGAKGGFVPKFLPQGGSREEIQAEAVACYKLFISNLLSVTDNLVEGKVVPPSQVVRYDGDDPYLVVAADKGTATFSDFANEISVAHNFWLGDAFASGGSVGYDHKKMGITARGGWEAVKRHFREMDVDIQSEPFRVIGVGDMSGDVFGNGMLLSKHICLVAAFDHRDIFIDPTPDAGATWKERKRLFDMGRSSWQDYNQKLISKGGGIFSRQLKAIPLSAEMKEITGLRGASATPNELIKALLRAEADLLWFGGIGTYVRASHESDDDAGDRANDALRIAAEDLNVKVVGEGANLGMTQWARIEFARHGGRINTDAIDNSAGVNSSDLEVNIKIALGNAMSEHDLTMAKRNKTLSVMTNAVAKACLENNYQQTLALSLEELAGAEQLGFQQRLMRQLEDQNLLDREIENLPDDGAMVEAMQTATPLSRPELAVLMAYAKISLFNQLIKTKVPDDAYLSSELDAYFPQKLNKEFAPSVASHRLKREIIATRISNAMINHGGITLVSRLSEETGRKIADIAYAFVAAWQVLGLEEQVKQIDALDTKISGELQLELYYHVQTLLSQQMTWFLQNIEFNKGLSSLVKKYQERVEKYRSILPKAITPDQKAHMQDLQQNLMEQAVPASVAQNQAMIGMMCAATDVIWVADKTKKRLEDVAQIYCALEEEFSFEDLRHAGEDLAITDYYDRIAITSTLEELSMVQRRLTEEVVRANGRKAVTLKAWQEAQNGRIEQVKRSLEDVQDNNPMSLAKLTVAVAHLRGLLST